LSDLQKVEFIRMRNHLPKPTFAIALGASLLALAVLASGQSRTPDSSCADCPVWNKPQQPFRIYGNAYYVGPRGLASILLTSRDGHILLDGALPESVPQVVANIRSLGFRIEDVKLIVNSHVHFDHGGGIAELQRLSGARVAASPWSVEVLTKSGIGKGDPQFAMGRPSA
jgi:metallo-beta-lactamase class B